MFLKLETSSFLQSSSFVLYFIMYKPGYGKTLPKGVNWGVTPHKIGGSDITVVFLKSMTSSFLQSSSFVLYFIMYKPG